MKMARTWLVVVAIGLFAGAAWASGHGEQPARCCWASASWRASS